MKVVEETNNRKTYYDHALEAEAPAKDRPTSITRRTGGKQIVRRHHLTPQQMDKLLARMQKEKRWIPPFHCPQAYWGLLEALYQLGPNKQHLLGDVYVKMKEIMSNESTCDAAGRTAWARFENKPNRSQTSGKDAFDRIWQNIRVLQRLGGSNPYGLKLAQVGACLNVYGSKNEPYIELHIGIPCGTKVTVINEARERNYPVSVNAVPSGFMPNGQPYVVDLRKIGDPHFTKMSATKMGADLKQAIQKATNTTKVKTKV